MRFLVLLIALALVGAPVDRACIETSSDVAAETSACEALLVHVPVIAIEPPVARLFTPKRVAAVPVAPALARIFRPPRSPIA
jgi:hypothetical protein